MFDRIRDYLINFITSRNTVLTLVFVFLASVLMHRVFELQIIKGESYMDEFSLKIRKERAISSSRGNIYDRNGKLLAYNELAYSVTIEDVYEAKNKNANLNATLLKTIHILEENGDDVVSDFNIFLNKDGEYEFAVSGTKLLRFIADIYGRTSIELLKEKEKNASAQDIIDYMATGYSIGERTDPEDKKTFVPGLGYSKEDTLKLIIIRYAMKANSYQKYIPTVIATDVSENTVAAIKENSEELLGVDIAEDTIRRYVNGTYFSHIIGYTGKASTEDLEELNSGTDLVAGQQSRYEMNDTVGKAGIEKVMETWLQGKKGSEIIYVDNMGKEIDSEGRIDPIAGNDVYLSLDADLQEAIYNILEQSIAGILMDKIINVKEYEITEGMSAANRKIAIDDVYFALFNNNVIDMEHLASEYAGTYEKEVYQAFVAKKEQVWQWIDQELYHNKVPYRDLPKEYQVYESYIVTDLLINSAGILSVETDDDVYQTWAKEETISLTEFLEYAIAQNWIDVSKLDLENSYAESGVVFDSLVKEIKERLETNDFLKKLFKYMLKDSRINGKQVCMILEEQDIISVRNEEIEDLKNGRTMPYSFMMKLIETLQITPAQLALDPYSGSCVVVHPDTGELLALVSYPSYDNNRLANGIDADYYAALQKDLSKPLWDYATQMRTAPGSTFKMVTSTSILMSHTAGLYDTVRCTGTFDRFDRPMRCWIYPNGSHGELTLSEAITHSCNHFFYEMAYQMGISGFGEEQIYDNQVANSKMLEYVELFGLSEKTGIEIEESVPLVSEDANASQAAIGQGSHGYTTVGLARYVTTVANSGTCFKLTLLDKVTDHNGNLLQGYEPSVRNKIEMPTSYWDAIHAGMKGVTDNKRYFVQSGITAAGKTGTAEENKLRPNHALFVGYAPYEDPEIAIATRIANGYTSDYAAQISCKVLQYYFELVDEDEILSGTADRPDTVTSSGD